MFQMINAVVIEKFKFKCVYDNNLSLNVFKTWKKKKDKNR